MKVGGDSVFSEKAHSFGHSTDVTNAEYFECF